MWMFKKDPVMEQQGHILQDNLLTSLTTYIELHICQKDYFLKTSDNLAQLCPSKKNKDKQNNGKRTILSGFCGASIGAVLGAISGSICGALGSVGTATVYSGELNAVGASVGLFGGVMGGMVGGIFSSTLGGALGAAAESSRHSVDSYSYYVTWCVIGVVTGARIGNIFGGTVGAVGGGFGGGLGGLFGVNVGVGVVKNVLAHVQDPKDLVTMAKQMEDIQKIQQTFQENAKNLVGELYNIKSISSKMATKSGAHIIAMQSTRSLAAVGQMERALEYIRKATSPENMTSCVGRAAEQCKLVSDEMVKMKIEAEKLLASWSKLT